MMRLVSMFALGALFAGGLIVSGMTDPANVRGFLDIFGNWRPQLIGVLAAAMLVTALLYRMTHGRAVPMLAPKFLWPTSTAIDARLIIGAVLFGAGWAWSGYCPGPALTRAGALDVTAWVLLASAAVGAILQRTWEHRHVKP